MSARLNSLLLGLAVLIAAAPMVLGLPGTYTGTDDKASQLVEEMRPGYQPWFAPLWQPPSKEIESLIFALQAALGAGVVGYVIGRIHGSKPQGRKDRR